MCSDHEKHLVSHFIASRKKRPPFQEQVKHGGHWKEGQEGRVQLGHISTAEAISACTHHETIDTKLMYIQIDFAQD